MDKNRGSFQLIDALALLALHVVFGMWYGFQHLVPESGVPAYFRAGSVIFVLCLAAIVAVRASGSRSPSAEMPQWLGIAASALVLGLTLFLNSKEVASGFGISYVVLWIVLMLPSAALLAAGKANAGAIAQAILCLVSLGALALTQPINVAAANMLPITQAACENLAHGVNPYTASYPEVSSFNFFYFPGAALPYCVAQAAQLDVRWINVIGYLAIAACIAATLPSTRRWTSFAVIGLPFLASPAAMQMLINGHLWVYWTLVAFAYLALRSERLQLASALLGATLGLRQLAVFLAVPLGGVLLVGGVGAIVRRALLGIAVLLVLLAPAWLAVDDFIGHFYTSISPQAAATGAHGINPQDQISISGFFSPGVARTVLHGLQALLLLVGLIATLVAALRRHTRFALTLAGVSALLVVSLNPFLHRYFYMEGLLLLVMTFASMPHSPQGRKAAPPAR